MEIESLRANNGGDGFIRVSYAGSEPPQDLLDVNGILTWLDERRVTEMEWRKVRDMMESARHLEVVTKKGEDVE